MNRRQFLGTSTGSIVGAGGLLNIGLFDRLAQAATLSSKKMIFIFQDGGNDGLNTVIPRGDDGYNLRNRPTLYIPEEEAIDVGNGFAQFHPALESLLDVYSESKINGQTGLGNLAVVHRVGYEGQSRSHFDSQHFWQNGIPGDSETEVGFIYRFLDAVGDLNSVDSGPVAAGLSHSRLLALKGEKLIPNFASSEDFNLPGGEKFLGEAPKNGSRANGTGISGLYGLAPNLASRRYNQLVYRSGQSLGRTIRDVQSAVGGRTYRPENGAIYPSGGFGQKLREAAQLLKRTDMQVIGLQIGGWDTHQRQGGVRGEHANLLRQLASGIRALSRDLENMWEDLIIVTMTEFGRTSKENGSRGTDHAESSIMFVAGGGVNGGVYNCDQSTWETGAMFSEMGRYLAAKTDFRAVFSEIFEGHFGAESGLMEKILPGYSIAKLDRPSRFKKLGIL